MGKIEIDGYLDGVESAFQIDRCGVGVGNVTSLSTLISVNLLVDKSVGPFVVMSVGQCGSVLI